MREIGGRLLIEDIRQLPSPMFAVSIFVSMQAFADCADRFALCDRIDRRIDVHPAGLSLPGAKCLFGFLSNGLYEVAIDGVIRILRRGDIKIDLCLSSTIVLVIRYVTFLVHSVQHHITSIESCLLVASGRVKAWRFWQAG